MKPSLTAARIGAALDIVAEVGHEAKPRRTYLGASVIGHACDAYCVMDMMGWPTEKKASTIRAAKLGHLIEAMVIEELREAGIRVNSIDTETGQQFEFVSHGGGFRCHLDGFAFIEADCFVLEIKSAKHSRYLKIHNEGLKLGERLYYDQVMTGMAMSDVGDALVIVIDKDTGDRHIEIIEFDPFHWAFITEKIERLLDNPEGAERVAASPENWRCKMCDRAKWCWGAKTPPVGTWMPKPATVKHKGEVMP